MTTNALGLLFSVLLVALLFKVVQSSRAARRAAYQRAEADAHYASVEQTGKQLRRG